MQLLSRHPLLIYRAVPGLSNKVEHLKFWTAAQPTARQPWDLGEGPTGHSTARIMSCEPTNQEPAQAINMTATGSVSVLQCLEIPWSRRPHPRHRRLVWATAAARSLQDKQRMPWREGTV